MDPSIIEGLAGLVPQWILTITVLAATWLKIINPWMSARSESKAGRSAGIDSIDSIRDQVVAINLLLTHHIQLEEQTTAQWMKSISDLREEIKTNRAEQLEELREYRRLVFELAATKRGDHA